MAGLSNQPVRTFSIGFDDPRYNELDYAREVARHCATEHHEFIVQPEAVRELLPRLVRQYDEPFGDSSALPTYYVSKLAREHVIVALSGDGGDEACAGYDRYSQALREGWVDKVPLQLRRVMLSPLGLLPVGMPGRRLGRRLSLKFSERYASMMRQMPPEQVTALLTADVAQRIGEDGAASVVNALRAAGDLDPLSQMQYADGCVYLPDDILVKVDRASMLNSLEVRCPLLDFHFLELMASVPPGLRLSNGNGKQLLKRAMRGILPDRILDRPKMGFGVPLETWFPDDLAAFVREILLDGRTARRGIFALPALDTLIRGQARLPQLTTHVWMVLFLSGAATTWMNGHSESRASCS